MLRSAAGPTGLLMYLIPLYNAGLAYLLLGERLAVYHLVGAALVLPGIYLARLFHGPRSTSSRIALRSAFSAPWRSFGTGIVPRAFMNQP